MNEFLKMDVFFVVATLATIAVSVLLCLILWHVFRIARTLDRVAAEVEEEAKILRKDIDEARLSVKREGVKIGKLLKPITKFLERHS